MGFWDWCKSVAGKVVEKLTGKADVPQLGKDAYKIESTSTAAAVAAAAALAFVVLCMCCYCKFKCCKGDIYCCVVGATPQSPPDVATSSTRGDETRLQVSDVDEGQMKDRGCRINHKLSQPSDDLTCSLPHGTFVFLNASPYILMVNTPEKFFQVKKGKSLFFDEF